MAGVPSRGPWVGVGDAVPAIREEHARRQGHKFSAGQVGKRKKFLASIDARDSFSGSPGVVQAMNAVNKTTLRPQHHRQRAGRAAHRLYA